MIGPRTASIAYPTKALGEVAEFLDHQRVPITASDRDPGPIPYYGANGQQDSVANWIFDEPLVLLAEDGGHFDTPHRGIAYRIEGKSWVNNHAHVLRPLGDLDTRWLARVLENYDVTPFLTGSTRAKLTKSGASRIPIPLPPLEEQQRIAQILDAADALRTKRREATTKLDELTQSIFIDMFGNESVVDVVSELGTIAEVQGGLQVTSKRRVHSMEVPYLRVANVYRGYLELSEVKTIRLTQRELQRTRLLEGDLLVVEGHGNEDEIGRVAVWDATIDPCVHQNHLIRVRCDRHQLLPRFAEAYMNSMIGRRALLRAANTTSGLNTISTGDVRGVKLPVPEMRMQERFGSLVSVIDVRREVLLNSATELDLLFRSLQQRAFRGEL